MSKDQLLIEELSLSGSVMLPGVTKRTVRNHAKSINAMLKGQDAKWHVEIEDSNVLVRVSDDALSPKTKKQFAEELIDELAARKILYGTRIYDGTNMYGHAHEMPPDAVAKITPDGTPYAVKPYKGCPCEYNNPDSLTLTFDGSGLYDAMNYGDASFLDEIGEKYGMYNEQGHAWSTAFYRI